MASDAHKYSVPGRWTPSLLKGVHADVCCINTCTVAAPQFGLTCELRREQPGLSIEDDLDRLICQVANKIQGNRTAGPAALEVPVEHHVPINTPESAYRWHVAVS